MHDVGLITTIAVCFMLAFALGCIADRLRLPPLVGYLFAGICVGPFTPGFVADAALTEQLAEIGVILLMFGVGLHFSIADLLAVRKVAIPGAVGQIVGMTAIGVWTGLAWGWPVGAGLVMGLSIAVASTVVLLKALEERSLIETPAGRVSVGWLIVEDLAMVLVLIILPILAPSLGSHAPDKVPATPFEGGLILSVALTIGKVIAFGALSFYVGPKVLPWLLKKVAKTGSRELFTLAVLSTALGIALGSALIFGVSFALGAFFAGVVLSESDFSHRAASDSLPFQDAFSVLFFVSVGMMFDPGVLIRQPVAVLSLVALIIVGKSISAMVLVAMLRLPISLGLVVAAGVAQVGEFSFILVGLGLTLGLLPTEGRDLVLAGALISIALNPLVFRFAKRLGEEIETALPASVSAYGQRGLTELKRELAIVRKSVEDRATAKALELKSLSPCFPFWQTSDTPNKMNSGYCSRRHLACPEPK